MAGHSGVGTPKRNAAKIRPSKLFLRCIQLLQNDLFQVLIRDIADDPTPVDEEGGRIVKIEGERQFHVSLYYAVVFRVSSDSEIVSISPISFAYVMRLVRSSFGDLFNNSLCISQNFPCRTQPTLPRRRCGRSRDTCRDRI